MIKCKLPALTKKLVGLQTEYGVIETVDLERHHYGMDKGEYFIVGDGFDLPLTKDRSRKIMEILKSNEVQN